MCPDPPPSTPVLVVGNGLIGSALRSRLEALGSAVVTVARSGADGSTHRARDLADERGRSALRTDLDRLAPRCVVLTHGPSDVTWIERNEAAAAAVHCGVAELVADARTPAVLVSTDNVFAGTRGRHLPGDPVEPANAYGRIKARAERILLAGGRALVLRVSLVYGWAGPAHRHTYAERCLLAAAAARPLTAPTDQSFTPVHVRDVAEVLAALCRADRLPGGVRHLSGPVELSRYEFATLAYRIAGADPGAVRRCLRRDTEWASRPRYSSLTCDEYRDVAGLERWWSMGPVEGLRAMLAERRGAAPHDGSPVTPRDGASAR